MSRLLKISNAKTRTILNKMVKIELIEKSSRRYGHSLSPYGKQVWMKCQTFIQIPSKRIYLGSSYTIGKKDAAVCVEGAGIENLNTVILRDEALINGALGCTVFLKQPPMKFFLLDAIYPPLPKKELSDRKIKRKLITIISDIPWSVSIIIIGTADHVINAQIGAISAALLLLPSEIKYYFQELL
ncbi:MAG: DUF4443 domain-containing protein [Candidatus Hodarchaeota archaeon]